MISGIGIDIATIEEFRRLLADPATHFFAAHFTPAELAYARAQVSDDPARHLAARYAAKEAAIKALRSAFCVLRSAKNPDSGQTSRSTQHAARSTGPVEYREIEVVSRADGAPWLVFHGAVAEAVERAGVTHAHLSLSHDAGTAVAMVVLEREGAGSMKQEA